MTQDVKVDIHARFPTVLVVDDDVDLLKALRGLRGRDRFLDRRAQTHLILLGPAIRVCSEE